MPAHASSTVRLGLILMLALALAGCGRRGPLHLPGEPPPAQSAPAG